MNFVSSNNRSLKIRGPGCRYIGIIKFEFVPKTQLPESKVNIYFLEVAVGFCKNRVGHLMQFLTYS